MTGQRLPKHLVLWYYRMMNAVSGKFVVRIPPELHWRLKDAARRQGSSLNQVCVARLQGAAREFSSASDTPASLISRSLIAGAIERWGADLAGLLLFGSAVRGEATRESDIDLLLVLKPTVRISRGLYLEWDVLAETFEPCDRRVSPQCVVLPEDVDAAGGLWYEVALEGVVLWERDLAVSALLRRLREGMARGELRRAMIHGNPYWTRVNEGRHEK